MDENNSGQSPIPRIVRDSFLEILQYLQPNDFVRVAKVSRAGNNIIKSNWHLALSAIPVLKNYSQTEKIPKDKASEILKMYFSIKNEMNLKVFFWTFGMKSEFLLFKYLNPKQIERAIFMIKINMVPRFDQRDVLHKKSHRYILAAARLGNFELFELMVKNGASVLHVEKNCLINFCSTKNNKIKSLIGILRAEYYYSINRAELAIKNIVESSEYDSVYLRDYIVRIREERKGFQIEYSIAELQKLEDRFVKIFGIDQLPDDPSCLSGHI